MNKRYNLTILWWTDGFWKWLAEYVLEHFWKDVSLTITGRDIERWEELQSSLYKKNNEYKLCFTTDNIRAVQDADIVVYSVPIAKTEQVIHDTLPYIKAWAVVADVTSIKKFPSKAMRQRDDIIVIPTHPMFGPYISSIAGQVIVLASDEKNTQTKEYAFLKKNLKLQKARVIEASPEYHDKMMAVVQGLTHLNMFVVGETMKRLQFNIADSMNFISPIYKLMISSVWRYLGQNPWLYADIQMYNDEVLWVHEKFLDTAKNFHTSVKEKDYDKFCQDVVDARDFLWKENCDAGQEYTDKVIYMIGQQVELLKKNIWKEILIKDIYSLEEIRGTLEKYENGTIFFASWEYSIDQYEVSEL